MKKNNFKGMEIPQLESKLHELKKELMKSNAQIATGTVPKNPGQIKQVKKNIARINNSIKEKQK